MNYLIEKMLNGDWASLSQCKVDLGEVLGQQFILSIAKVAPAYSDSSHHVYKLVLRDVFGHSRKVVIKFTSQKMIAKNQFWQRYNQIFAHNFPEYLLDSHWLFEFYNAREPIRTPEVLLKVWSKESRAGFLMVSWEEGVKLKQVTPYHLAQVGEYLSSLQRVKTIELEEFDLNSWRQRMQYAIEASDISQAAQARLISQLMESDFSELSYCIVDLRWDQFICQPESQRLVMLDLDAMAIMPSHFNWALLEIWLTPQQCANIQSACSREMPDLSGSRELWRWLIWYLELFGVQPLDKVLMAPISFGR